MESQAGGVYKIPVAAAATEFSRLYVRIMFPVGAAPAAAAGTASGGNGRRRWVAAAGSPLPVQYFLIFFPS